MLQKIVNLITLVGALIQTDPENYDEITKQVEAYDAAKADIKQFHGDHELAAPQVVEELDKVVLAARAAQHPGEKEATSIIEDQDDARGTTGVGETGSGADDEKPETEQDLMANNTKDQLVEIARAEDIDLGDAQTKPAIAAKIIEARDLKKNAG